MTTLRRLASALAALLALVIAMAAFAEPAAEALARGDAAWQQRAKGYDGGVPPSGPVVEAIAAYEQASKADPDDLEARWKLLRALHFSFDFLDLEDAEARRRIDRAQEVAAEGLTRLERAIDVPLAELDPAEQQARAAARGLSATDLARLHFWAAIVVGAWSREAGLLAVVRRGVADELRGYAEVAMALDPTLAGGGSQRLLGRLHATLPRVPFFSGWVDRSRAIPLLEQAHELAPEHPGNLYLLGITLLELAPERRSEAAALLRRAADAEPRAAYVVEDLDVRRRARERLAELEPSDT